MEINQLREVLRDLAEALERNPQQILRAPDGMDSKEARHLDKATALLLQEMVSGTCHYLPLLIGIPRYHSALDLLNVIIGEVERLNFGPSGMDTVEICQARNWFAILRTNLEILTQPSK